MINLLTKSVDNFGPLEKTKHLILAITTLIIVVFVVSVVSILAISFYQNTKDRELTGQIELLNSQINKLSSREARIRQIDLRQKSINKFIENRAKTAAQLNSLNIMSERITIDSWDFVSGKMSVISSASADLQQYTQELKTKFAKFQLDNTIQKGGSWISTLTLK